MAARTIQQRIEEQTGPEPYVPMEASVAYGDITITITPPPSDKPGYLRRLKKIGDIQASINDKSKFSGETIESLVDVLVNECEISGVPEDMDVEEVVWDLSEDQIQPLLDVMSGKKEVPTKKSSV